MNTDGFVEDASESQDARLSYLRARDQQGPNR